MRYQYESTDADGYKSVDYINARGVTDILSYATRNGLTVHKIKLKNEVIFENGYILRDKPPRKKEDEKPKRDNPSPRTETKHQFDTSKTNYKPSTPKHNDKKK